MEIEIAINVRAHKIISDDFLKILKFDKITLICTDLWLWNSKADFVPILSWYMQKNNWENEHVNIHVPLLFT
jgi:hypothetical protein